MSSAVNLENSSGPTKCSADNACMCSLVSALAAQEENVIHVIDSAPICYQWHSLITFSNSLDTVQARQNFLARMCVYEVSYEPNSLLVKKVVLFFKHMFSVLNHLPAFGVCFFIAVSVFAGMRLCAVSY